MASDHPVTAWLYAVAEKDRTAFAELYRATAPKLLGVILRILKDRARAEDVLQESFIKVWQRAALFDETRSSPITWLVSIARNAAIDALRKQPVEREGQETDIDEIPSRSPNVIDRIDDVQAQARLNRCFEELDKDRADMVRLAYLNGWTRDALADYFEQPVNTVKTWLHRALKQLKRCLDS
ncbi:sigma-70 family RNA polymerase sigma factor [Marinobacter nauticus]|uniref:sigma-70 family RNA polymerase sigma factor n=1 Tax=Marinobacter nauticus TaxID=2743 RepID=UPI001CFEE657|nr:sigma-70 family RNA polymerase sigma factor [Marinobacter nauticus]